MVHSATVRPTETRHCTRATVYLQWDERRALIGGRWEISRYAAFSSINLD